MAHVEKTTTNEWNIVRISEFLKIAPEIQTKLWMRQCCDGECKRDEKKRNSRNKNVNDGFFLAFQLNALYPRQHMHMQMHGCSYVLIKSLLNIMSHDNEWMCNNIRYTNLETRKAKQTGYFSSMNVECLLNQISSFDCKVHTFSEIHTILPRERWSTDIVAAVKVQRPICLTLWMFRLEWRRRRHRHNSRRCRWYDWFLSLL